MRSYVKRKASLSFVWGRCFLSRQLHEIISCTTNGGGSGGNNNKRRQHISFDELHAPFNHIIIIISLARATTTTHQLNALCEKGRTSCQGVVFFLLLLRGTTSFFCAKEASLVIDHLQNKTKKRKYNITHNFS